MTSEQKATLWMMIAFGCIAAVVLLVLLKGFASIEVPYRTGDAPLSVGTTTQQLPNTCSLADTQLQMDYGVVAIKSTEEMGHQHAYCKIVREELTKGSNELNSEGLSERLKEYRKYCALISPIYTSYEEFHRCKQAKKGFLWYEEEGSFGYYVQVEEVKQTP